MPHNHYHFSHSCSWLAALISINFFHRSSIHLSLAPPFILRILFFSPRRVIATANFQSMINIFILSLSLILFICRAIRMDWKKVDLLALAIWAHGHRPDFSQPLDTIHTIPHWPPMGKSNTRHTRARRPQFHNFHYSFNARGNNWPFHHESWLRRFNTGQKNYLYCTRNRGQSVRARASSAVAPMSPYFTHKHFLWFTNEINNKSIVDGWQRRPGAAQSEKIITHKTNNNRCFFFFVLFFLSLYFRSGVRARAARCIIIILMLCKMGD